MNAAGELHSTCYEVLRRGLTGESFSPSERSALCARLQAYQDARTGFFADPAVPPQDTPERSWSFLSIEMTHLCLAALAELEARPGHPLRALGPIGRHPDAVRAWLGQVQWWLLWPPPPDPSSRLRDLADWVGEELLHFGGALMMAVECGQASEETVTVLLDELAAAVDPATGLWGTQHGCARERALTGSAAIARLFFYSNRALPTSFNLADGLIINDNDSPRARWIRTVARALNEPERFRLRGPSALNCWAPESSPHPLPPLPMGEGVRG